MRTTREHETNTPNDAIEPKETDLYMYTKGFTIEWKVKWSISTIVNDLFFVFFLNPNASSLLWLSLAQSSLQIYLTVFLWGVFFSFLSSSSNRTIQHRLICGVCDCKNLRHLRYENTLFRIYLPELTVIILIIISVLAQNLRTQCYRWSQVSCKFYFICFPFCCLLAEFVIFFYSVYASFFSCFIFGAIFWGRFGDEE